MLKDLARKLASPALRRIDARIESRSSQRAQAFLARVEEVMDAKLRTQTRIFEEKIAELDHVINQRVGEGIHRRLFLPNNPPLPEASGDFMSYSTCSAADFLHPQYAAICHEIKNQPIYHRKLWEWVFVIYHLQKAGVLRAGNRGLGFGVGQERLPALFAKYGTTIVATDAPDELGQSAGWVNTSEHSSGISQLLYSDIVDSAVVLANVMHRPCDMTEISDDLTDFDFTWSCCSFEHLGSLEAGMQFVIDSVEKSLKIGGIACHTTEFNLSSDDETISEGPTVLYRKKDMLELTDRLRARGHEVASFAVAPDAHYLDGYVDVPPYTHNPHIKLELAGYVTTSVGLVIKRGR
jgi:hypothetical protein